LSARADDGDYVAGVVTAAAAIGIGDCSGNIATIRLMVGRSLRESLRLAIGVGRRRAAFFAGGKATVDAIAVGIIGDDEHASLGLCGRHLAEAQQRNEADENCPHFEVSVVWKRQPGANVDSDNVSEIVKRRLTVRPALGYQIFPVFYEGSSDTLTIRARQIIVPP
jgi:hypothetical protein